MEHIQTLADFYQLHPVDNQKVFIEHNAGHGHFNVFRRQGCKTRSPFTRRDFYKITLIIGKGRLHYADRIIEVDAPALVFSGPSVQSSWESANPQQSGWFCLFTQAFIEPYEHKNAIQDFSPFKPGGNHVVFLNEEQQQFVSVTMGRMMEEMDSDYAGKYDLLRHYLHILMHEAVKTSPVTTYDAGKGAAARLTTMFLELLERQFPIDSPSQSLTVKTANDYASLLSVHTNHLNRSVKEVTGKTTTQHISERILKEAHALLKHSDWNIAQVANGLGFEEPAYFTNFFRKQMGVAPGVWKERV